MEDLPQPAVQTADLPTMQPDPFSPVENEMNELISDMGENAAVAVSSHRNENEPTDALSNEPIEIDGALVPQPIILNRALVKPLRRLWKQNQTLRLRLQRDLNQKPSPTPPFISRLNEQVRLLFVFRR